MTQLIVAGLEVVARPSGALWIAAHQVLIAADLHLEKGSAYARRGQLLPPWDTHDTLGRLAGEIDETDPATVILLGDSLHDAGAADRLAIEDLALIGAIARRRRLIWIAGNHDRDGLDGLPGEILAEFVIGGLTLRHEPRVGADHAWAAGHLHPCARVRAAGGAVRRRCFVTDGHRIVLPAFGAFAGGLNVKDEAYGGLFATKPMAVVLGRSRSYAVAWGSLRAD